MTKYIFICDRCGKELPNGGVRTVLFRHVKSDMNIGELCTAGRGDVCKECLQDFCDIAESFFDDLNKEATDGKADG